MLKFSLGLGFIAVSLLSAEGRAAVTCSTGAFHPQAGNITVEEQSVDFEAGQVYRQEPFGWKIECGKSEVSTNGTLLEGFQGYVCSIARASDSSTGSFTVSQGNKAYLSSFDNLGGMVWVNCADKG